ncbi:MAG: asparagine synthase (glutamine-hydrolyzing) [Candidatus Omnitrophica bacterium]|nr:asparagine synthase (glutamine-hydrolyzing) [Candidatus Omnitrophota bacterium]
MCGIAGYLGKKAPDTAAIERALRLMKNRGPDSSRWEAIRSGGEEAVLLHSRLSIIDLDPRSGQPFTIGPATIIFNGEIYNYLELRAQLEKRGIQFTTSSDTEVLLQSYLLFGEECVKDFEGMWSFAIFDRRSSCLFLSRDRFAEKPLYYWETGDGFYFGSEIKFLKALSGLNPNPNSRHLLRFMINGYRSIYKSGDTFFEGVKEVPYASNLVLQPDSAPRLYRYWRPKRQPRKMTLEESIDGFQHHLMESIKIRLRADVPLAFCLSGGIDSGTIVSIAAKKFKYDVATFSIVDPDERYDESQNIRATVEDLQCKNTIIKIRPDHADFFPRLEKLITYHDAPLYTITYFVHSLLVEEISRQGYKVSFSGTGADEIVTGYYDHYLMHLYEMRDRPDYMRCLSDWKTHVAGYIQNPLLKTEDLFTANPNFRGHVFDESAVFTSFLKSDFREDFSEEQFCSGLLRNRMMNEMFHEIVPVVLHDDDLNSMYYSVENRTPYLDSRLFEFAHSIPEEHLIKNGYAKFILREAAKGFLNDTVRLDRCKKGFNASIQSLINFEDKQVRDMILDDSKIYELFDKTKIEPLLSNGYMTNSYKKFLFSFLNVKIFLDKVAKPVLTQEGAL